MLLSIIIVNWNTKNLLRACLRSLFACTRDITFEVLVTDNGSADGSVEMVQKEFPQVIVTANKKNAGFAKANNQSLARARGEYILFMNPDMEVRDNALGKMVLWLKTRPEIGLATCRLQYPDGSPQHTIKRDPTVCDQALIMLALHHVLQSTKCLQRYFAKDIDYSREQGVEQIMGSFVMGSRTVIVDVLKGWDEYFFLWWEDADLCKRARNLGYPVVYTPMWTVVHAEGQAMKQIMKLKKHRRYLVGMCKYFKKHGTLFDRLIILALAPVSFAIALLIQSLRIKPRPQGRL